jgi:phospholipid-binding lipoprotein MlaA
MQPKSEALMRTVVRQGLPHRVRCLAAGAILAVGLAGCATPPPASDPDALADFRQTNDPLEPTNRVFYKINDGIDTVILKPAAQAYRAVLPDPVRTGIHNILDNMAAPVRGTDDALQGKPMRAGDTTMRFLINSTVGVGGIFDVAKKLGYPNHDTDFALTLANWDVPEGPYLYLPILGPSSPRDAAGFAADMAIDPFTWIGQGTTAHTIGSWTRTVLHALDERSDLLDAIDSVKKTALDPYATFRSLYRQNRAAKLASLRADNGATIPIWWPQGAKAGGTGQSQDQTPR